MPATQFGVRRTRGGDIRLRRRDFFYHAQIPCRVELCKVCPLAYPDEDALPCLLNPSQPVTVLDMFALSDMENVFRLGDFSNVVCLQSALDHLRSTALGIYENVKNAVDCVFPDQYCEQTHVHRIEGESMEAHVMRQTRAVACWYSDHHPNLNVRLASNLPYSSEQEEGDIGHVTIEEFLKELPDQEAVAFFLRSLEDRGAVKRLKQRALGEDADLTPKFAPWLSKEEAQNGLASGRFLRGKIQCVPGSRGRMGTVSMKGVLDRVIVEGLINMNRSMTGDIVVVESLGESSIVVNNLVGVEDDLEAIALLAEDSDEDCIEQATDSVEPTAVPNGRSFAKLRCRVVFIERHQSQRLVGTLREGEAIQGSNRTGRIFIPLNTSMPMVRVMTRSSDILEGQLIEVSIDEWLIWNIHPQGHWTRILGDADDPTVFSEAILISQNVITRGFPKGCFDELPPQTYEISAEEASRRVDYRLKDRRIFTCCSVDPPGCKDIDDALSCEWLKDGSLEFGVHIADVTHFVRNGGAIDMEARERCTTVYLVDRRTDMLPGLLTTNLCSLVGQRDRLAFSVVWRINTKGDIIDTKFSKSVICSDAALSYEKAQIIIDDKDDQSTPARGLRELMRVSKVLRKRRMDNGSLVLASNETSFTLDKETNEVQNCVAYPSYDTNKMIEEFMLLANCCVAERIQEEFPRFAVLRRHPDPDRPSLIRLSEQLQKYRNLSINFCDSKTLSDSLDKVLVADDFYFNTAVRILTTRCMNAAVYINSNDFSTQEFKHYGLAVPMYTHFTSPIRRYADIMVHRLLAASIGWQPLNEEFSHADFVSSQARLMSQKHREAQWAGRASVGHAAASYFMGKDIMECDAVVTQVADTRIGFILKRFGIEGAVHFKDGDVKADDDYLKSRKGCWEGKLGMFDSVTVKMVVKKKHGRKQMNYEILRKTLPSVVAKKP